MITLKVCVALLGAGLGLMGCAQMPQAPQTPVVPAGTALEGAAAQPAAATPSISQDALLSRLAAGDDSVLVVDVRSAEEFAQGHVPGAINVPHDAIDAHLETLRSAEGKDIVLYCESGRRAGMAERTLRDKGFSRLLHLEGYMQQWRERVRDQEP